MLGRSCRESFTRNGPHFRCTAKSRRPPLSSLSSNGSVVALTWDDAFTFPVRDFLPTMGVLVVGAVHGNFD